MNRTDWSNLLSDGIAQFDWLPVIGLVLVAVVAIVVIRLLSKP